MFSEAEARKKWCPYARVGNEAGCNRAPQDFGATALCIGSNCMAWQWSNLKIGHDPEFQGAKAAEEFTKNNPLRGFCGAFTHPSS